LAVLFDLDGTLIDTTALIFQSYQHALSAVLGGPATADELFLAYGRPLYEAFGAILTSRGDASESDERTALIEQLVVTYRAYNVEHHDALAMGFPGVRETVEELRRRGYPIGLVTSKARGIAVRGLRLIGLETQLRAAVFMEDTSRHKPEPDPVWAALDRLELRDRANEVLFVGDSTHDLLAGRAAGVSTAAALWGPFPPESLLALRPDYALAAVDDLLDLFPPQR
jgi:pyrophosphatase PpaX